MQGNISLSVLRPMKNGLWMAKHWSTHGLLLEGWGRLVESWWRMTWNPWANIQCFAQSFFWYILVYFCIILYGCGYKPWTVHLNTSGHIWAIRLGLCWARLDTLTKLSEVPFPLPFAQLLGLLLVMRSAKHVKSDGLRTVSWEDQRFL